MLTLVELGKYMMLSNDSSVLDIVVLTQVEYDAIINKDEDTLYFIKEIV